MANYKVKFKAKKYFLLNNFLYEADQEYEEVLSNDDAKLIKNKVEIISCVQVDETSLIKKGRPSTKRG